MGTREGRVENSTIVQAFTLSEASWGLVNEVAERKMIGGKSSARGGYRDLVTLKTDQLVGQIGELAGCKHLWNDNLRYLEQSRMEIPPGGGDGGVDFPDTNIDVKASLIRTSRPLWSHHLLVRPVEYKADRRYVLALVQPPLGVGTKVHLLGHELGGNLRMKDSGPFRGAYACLASELDSMGSLTPELCDDRVRSCRCRKEPSPLNSSMS